MSELFVIGHPRCATTSIASWLSKHKEFDVSLPKEVRYFDMNYHKGINWYMSHFSGSGVLVDCNPYNSFVNYTAERIKDTFPNAKILQVVRNPADRIYSWWRLFHTMRPGREPRPFSKFLLDDALTYNTNRFSREGDFVNNLDAKGGPYCPFILESGAYFTTFERYNSLFSDVKVVLFEEITGRTTESESLLDQVLCWATDGELTESNISFTKSTIEENWLQGSRSVASSISKSDRRLVAKLFLDEVGSLSHAAGIDLVSYWRLDNDLY